MTIPNTLPSLTALFEKLGARDPASWAASQLEEGIPQLHRFVFLREAWCMIVSDGDLKWIESRIRETEKRPDAPYAGVGAALKRAREAGVSPADLTEIARGMQVQLLFGLCYMLEDNGLTEPELEGVGWGLFQADDDGQPLGPIRGLHESVLDTDPTGREMRPKRA
jgi:hypothetical protein